MYLNVLYMSLYAFDSKTLDAQIVSDLNHYSPQEYECLHNWTNETSPEYVFLGLNIHWNQSNHGSSYEAWHHLNMEQWELILHDINIIL